MKSLQHAISTIPSQGFSPPTASYTKDKPGMDMPIVNTGKFIAESRGHSAKTVTI